MKKTLKILVSLLLIVAILSSIGWYLFQYDPGFTRDILLQQARKFEQRGRNSIAVWLYNLAYRQANQDDSVAIELSEYYKSIGNYTKAEYTLSKAIEEEGTLDLYIALCKIFVEQDKLRDAVTMLDHISDPAIKQQLDSMRPAAPTASYSSGHYSQYITVAFTAENSTVYASTDQDFPSIHTDLYTEALLLSRGETTFFAVAVGENGLVSPLAEYQYSVEGVVEEVYFADSAFEDAVRTQLGVSESSPIFSDTLWQITNFQIPSAAISCEDLIWLPNLTELIITGCAFQDLQIIETMTKLQTLTIRDSVLSAKDIAVIAALPSLQSLTLSGCYLSSIEHLAGATNLTYLDLSRNSIRNLEALSGLSNLTHLDLRENALVNLDAISGLTNLEYLDVSYNSLTTTAPVANLVNLTHLDISSNNLMNFQVSGITALTELTWFAAANNNLIHVDFLSNSTKLKYLNVSDNTILNIQVLSAHTALEHLDFSYNEVEALPTFSKECPLTIINGGHNMLSSLDGLVVLHQLEYIYMDYNSGIKKIDKLANCPALKLVNVYGTGVRNASKLIDKGITVNFTPV